jgi:AP-3 complex subunit beta
MAVETPALSSTGIVMIGLNKLVKDRNPWVRKSVAGGLAKVYE